jgi:chorismate dehydratase
MPYRIATVPFLNAWPLVEALRIGVDLGDGPIEIELQSDVPSALPELLFADQVDVALLPVVELFRGGGGGIVPGIGIACHGPVESVKLFARVAPAAIGRVHVDKGSRTSVALLRILLTELYDVRPDLNAGAPVIDELLKREEAALVIGDACFAAERRFRAEASRGESARSPDTRNDDAPRGAGNRETAKGEPVRGDASSAVHWIDLGAAWQKMTGLPFVFAVWVFGRSFMQRSERAETARLTGLLTASRDWGIQHLDELSQRAAAEGRLGPGGESTAAAIHRYLSTNVRYTLGERDMAGLQRFHELCVKHSICPAGRAPIVAASGKGE